MMTRSTDSDTAPGRLAPERTFVIQVRTGSDFDRPRVHGRIEHVVSGDSEPFSSLEEAVAFMNRHLAPPAESTKAAAKPVKGKGKG